MNEIAHIATNSVTEGFTPPDTHLPNNIAEGFCGQTQPHASHEWRTPYDPSNTQVIYHYQCGGHL